MKCPECNYNQQAKAGMHCKGRGCGYTFTFNPKEYSTSQMTDGRFLAAIRKASQNGTAYFTKNQLYAAYAAKQTYPRGCLLTTSVVLAIVAVGFVASGEVVGAAIPAGLSLLLFLSGAFGKPHIHRRDRFMDMIDKWHRDRKPIDRLISEPTLGDPPPNWNESDIYDYGVERVMIVQRDILVDLLVFNNVHAEQRTLVISETGYPKYMMPLARKFLTERPDLPVFILHDADARGMKMMQRVQSMDLPLGERQIIDLGMTSADFKKLKRTKQYNPRQRRRDLPVDAMATSFLFTGLAASFATSMAFGDLIDEHAREAANASIGSDFG